VLLALALTPWRDRLAPADNALLLVVVIVAVATSGRRWAAALCALAAALSFDYFLTRPYLSLRINRTSDLVTELLLLFVGLSVGDLAARGRRHRTTAEEGREHLQALHALTELGASGRPHSDVILAATAELQRLLVLRKCTFSEADSGLAARIEPDGGVLVGTMDWAPADLGLPHRGVDLPVRKGGAIVGHFVLDPTPGVPVDHQALLVAVAIADQVGAAMPWAPRPVRSSR
jgi:K+-sensing histidine kinase KdpD